MLPNASRVRECLGGSTPKRGVPKGTPVSSNSEKFCQWLSFSLEWQGQDLANEGEGEGEGEEEEEEENDNTILGALSSSSSSSSSSCLQNVWMLLHWRFLRRHWTATCLKWDRTSEVPSNSVILLHEKKDWGRHDSRLPIFESCRKEEGGGDIVGDPHWRLLRRDQTATCLKWEDLQGPSQLCDSVFIVEVQSLRAGRFLGCDGLLAMFLLTLRSVSSRGSLILSEKYKTCNPKTRAFCDTHVVFSWAAIPIESSFVKMHPHWGRKEGRKEKGRKGGNKEEQGKKGRMERRKRKEGGRGKKKNVEGKQEGRKEEKEGREKGRKGGNKEGGTKEKEEWKEGKGKGGKKCRRKMREGRKKRKEGKRRKEGNKKKGRMKKEREGGRIKKQKKAKEGRKEGRKEKSRKEKRKKEEERREGRKEWREERERKERREKGRKKQKKESEGRKEINGSRRKERKEGERRKRGREERKKEGKERRKEKEGERRKESGGRKEREGRKEGKKSKKLERLFQGPPYADPVFPGHDYQGKHSKSNFQGSRGRAGPKEWTQLDDESPPLLVPGQHPPFCHLVQPPRPSRRPYSIPDRWQSSLFLKASRDDEAPTTSEGNFWSSSPALARKANWVTLGQPGDRNQLDDFWPSCSSFLSPAPSHRVVVVIWGKIGGPEVCWIRLPVQKLSPLPTFANGPLRVRVFYLTKASTHLTTWPGKIASASTQVKPCGPDKAYKANGIHFLHRNRKHSGGGPTEGIKLRVSQHLSPFAFFLHPGHVILSTIKPSFQTASIFCKRGRANSAVEGGEGKEEREKKRGRHYYFPRTNLGKGQPPAQGSIYNQAPPLVLLLQPLMTSLSWQGRSG
ncbi:Histone-lysine N-methyltransferase, H3 lysine-79 specific, partial [Ophiophagus hannah]